ncbi:hypothetical protein [Micromonospora sp. 050-3]|uniref:hypothetical protein n=1 Tax=Micromonospora sp. 050-3 TaxID=2789265 RepID=UPI00397A12D6
MSGTVDAIPATAIPERFVSLHRRRRRSAVTVLPLAALAVTAPVLAPPAPAAAPFRSLRLSAQLW